MMKTPGATLLACLLVVLADAGLAAEPKESPWQGALVICGGGRLPTTVRRRFLELAGGKEARLVVVPTASATADTADPDRFLSSWRQLGVTELSLLHTRDRKRANDVKFVAPLKTATGVWIGGGQQSRIATAYAGTLVETELQGVLKRGGVVGGTSAGAAVMSRVMIASGNPIPRVSRGFDLLRSVVIDQHFLVRERQPRLRRVIRLYPERIGLGIDEGTAIVVRGGTLQVMGRSAVLAIGTSRFDEPVRERRLNPGPPLDLAELRKQLRR